MTDHAQRIERTWELIKKIGTCFFVTKGAAVMRGRPLAAIPKQEENRIYFLIDRKQGLKDDELTENSQVYLAFGDGLAKFVSVTGTASVSDDAALVRTLWNPGGPSGQTVHPPLALPRLFLNPIRPNIGMVLR